MSRNAAVLLSSALFITLVIRWACSVVVCFRLKLNWWSGIILVSCSIGLIRVRKIFSNSF